MEAGQSKDAYINSSKRNIHHGATTIRDSPQRASVKSRTNRSIKQSGRNTPSLTSSSSSSSVINAESLVSKKSRNGLVTKSFASNNERHVQSSEMELHPRRKPKDSANNRACNPPHEVAGVSSELLNEPNTLFSGTECANRSSRVNLIGKDGPVRTTFRPLKKSTQFSATNKSKSDLLQGRQDATGCKDNHFESGHVLPGIPHNASNSRPSCVPDEMLTKPRSKKIRTKEEYPSVKSTATKTEINDQKNTQTNQQVVLDSKRMDDQSRAIRYASPKLSEGRTDSYKKKQDSVNNTIDRCTNASISNCNNQSPSWQNNDEHRKSKESGPVFLDSSIKWRQHEPRSDSKEMLSECEKTIIKSTASTTSTTSTSYTNDERRKTNESPSIQDAEFCSLLKSSDDAEIDTNNNANVQKVDSLQWEKLPVHMYKYVLVFLVIWFMVLVASVLTTTGVVVVKHGFSKSGSTTVCQAFTTLTENDGAILECEIDGDFFAVEVDGMGRPDMSDDPLFKSGRMWLEIRDAVIDPSRYVISAKTAPVYKAMLSHQRKLAVTGSRSVLVVRVVAGGKTTTANELKLSDSVFGNNADGDGADDVNLKTQYQACSQGKLIFKEATDRTGVSSNIQNGVVTVVLSDNPATTDRLILRNRVSERLKEQFGVDANELADHLMYCFPPGTANLSIAEATTNSFLSWYNDDRCTYSSAQMHEVGHNLGMAHATNENETSAVRIEYGDMSGAMGFSLRASNTKMCFNAGHFWQLGWFTGSDALDITLNDLPMVVTLDGFVKSAGKGAAKILRVAHPLGPSASSRDIYALFNWATAYNSDTRMGEDQITVVGKDVPGTATGRTYLTAILGEGGTFSIENFGTDCTLSGTATRLDTTNGTAVLTLSANGEGCPTPSPTPVPTPSPKTSPPTSPPTLPPTPTPTPLPTPAPTAPPSPTPTSPRSNPPTPSTTAPTPLDIDGAPKPTTPPPSTLAPSSTLNCPIIGEGVRITSCSHRRSSYEKPPWHINFCPAGSVICEREYKTWKFADGLDVTHDETTTNLYNGTITCTPVGSAEHNGVSVWVNEIHKRTDYRFQVVSGEYAITSVNLKTNYDSSFCHWSTGAVLDTGALQTPMSYEYKWGDGGKKSKYDKEGYYTNGKGGKKENSKDGKKDKSSNELEGIYVQQFLARVDLCVTRCSSVTID